MPTVIITPKYQIVIPKEIRDSLDIQPGEKVQIFKYENRIELIPLKKYKKNTRLSQRDRYDSKTREIAEVSHNRL